MADDPRASSPNRSILPSLLDSVWLLIVLKRNDLAMEVTWTMLNCNCSVVDNIAQRSGGLIGLQQVPMNGPTSVSENDQHCFWRKSVWSR
ncbi:hypothetical protein KIN20_017309 [Parelaphostrongylus tenuis]|uniref:Uncharacterized protein n=1 Tax=Parelaphostrongylus tenuis TaxID=148309 RepID=A0AAD5MIE1_PARTN|nr:hypothetical protein KIN20_017309 [Parelaphostrongylus tenuis]